MDRSQVSTAIDDLPYANPTDDEINGPVRSRKPPESVSEGRLYRDIVMIAWPSLIELILTQLTSMADQAMVGALPGDAGVMAIASVGLATQPKFLLMTMVQAMCVGSTALIARFRGQQDRKRANEVFRQALVLNILISALFMIVGLAFAEWLITFMGGSGDITEATLRDGIRYFNIQMYGFVPLCLGFTVTAALRGIGDTKIPLVYNTIANVVNLIMNYIMIYGRLGCPEMGVEGAAWATIIGQTVAALIAAAVVLRKTSYIRFDFRERFRFDKTLIGNVAMIGVPSMVEQLFMRAGLIIYTRTVAGLGDLVYSTHLILMSIQSMTVMMGQAVADPATTRMGQTLGKRRYDMAAIYMSRTQRLGIVTSLAMSAALVLWNDEIISIFNKTPAVIATGAPVLIMLAATQPFQSAQFITAGGLRGAGDTRYTALVYAITVLGIRSGLGLLFMRAFRWGIWGAWIALVSDQLMRTVLMSLRYHSGRWKRMAAERFRKVDNKA